MADTWTAGPADSAMFEPTGNPPAANTNWDSDAAWQQYIKTQSGKYAKKREGHHGKLVVRGTVEVVEYPVSGGDPTDWKDVGKINCGYIDFTVWERTYSSITFQKYHFVNLVFLWVYYSGLFGLDGPFEDVLGFESFYVAFGQPITKLNVRSYYKKESSWAAKGKTITITVGATIGASASGPTASVTAGATSSSSTVEGASAVITTSPGDEKKPPKWTKYGDPADELKTKTARYLNSESGSLVRLPIRIVDRGNNNQVSLEIDGRSAALLSIGEEATLELALPRQSSFTREMEVRLEQQTNDD